MSETPTESPREARLKAIQEAHDEWVEETDEESLEPDTKEFPDGNMYTVDLEADPEPFLAKVEARAPAEGETGNPELDKAMAEVEALVAEAKKKIQAAVPPHSTSPSSGSGDTATGTQSG